MRIKQFLAAILVVGIIPLLISSCADVRKTVYFADQRDSTIRSLNSAPLTYIQPNDILSITVSSLNPGTTAIFNTPNSATGGSSLQASGYLVNREGKIQFPVLGDVKTEGMTTDQLRNYLTRQLIDKKLLLDPIVTVRQLNFKVSVLGEVSRPAVLNIPSEKVSLLEALGLAGDITIYGRKDNVMVIREENGVKKIKRLDLNSNELFRSQYYYLKSNDIVYVEANKAKVAGSSRGVQVLPIVLSGLSLAAIIVEVILRR